MGDVMPRVGRNWGVGRTLLCGFPTCDGRVGGVVLSGLRRLLPVPFQPHPGSRELRGMAEAQAPEDAYAAAVWVMPEGFRFDAEADVWRVTRRGSERLRQVRRHDDAPVHRATHRQRPTAAGAITFAAAVPLPAVAICPQRGCGRRNAVTRDLLSGLFARLADELNDAATQIRADPTAGSRWLADRTCLSVEDLTAIAQADPTFLTRLAIDLPEWLLLEAACAGSPVEASDFCAVDLPGPLMVAQPDAGHLPIPAADTG